MESGSISKSTILQSLKHVRWDSLSAKAFNKLAAVALRQDSATVVAMLVKEDVDSVIKCMCAMDAASAAKWIKKYMNDYRFISVVAHHGYTDLASDFISRDADGVVKYLCSLRADEARHIVEKCLGQCRLIRVAVHHGFTDLVKRFIARDSDGDITSHAWTPTSPDRLSYDNAKNAWLWLMIGDGDLDGKVWAAVEAGGLVNNAAVLVDGVLKSGRKVTRDVATAMVKKYPDVLHNAVKYRYNLDVVKCLLKAGADVNKQDVGGCTPLHWVSDVAIARYLVESKADPSIRNKQGLTPLGRASKINRPAVADYLRSIGAPE
jgi:hypothetical protein